MKRVIPYLFLVFFLCNCGASQGVPSSAPVSTDLDSNSNSNQPVISTSKSVDASLEHFVSQIKSEDYAGEMIVQFQSDTVPVEGITYEPLFGKDPVAIKNMVEQVEIISGKKLVDLSTFYKVSVTDRTKAENLLRQLWKGRGVQYVYPHVRATSPGIQSIPDLSGRQGYLNSFESTGGLGFEGAWARGAKGDGVGIVETECEWNPEHEDLPRQRGIRSSGVIGCHPTDIAHGTAVLGVLVGVDADSHGIKGTSTRAQIETAGNRCLVGTGTGPLTSANNLSSLGGLVLCEQGYLGPATASPSSTQGQPGYMLPEAYPDVFASVQFVTALGFSVIEPSGNGSVNLDRSDSYFPNGPDLRTQDSGSIVVGATMGGTNRTRAVWSNCGARVNLHAWGAGVVTTSYPGVGYDWLGSTPPPFNNDPSQPNTYYTNAFGGTSSAAAMVTGAAAILQGYAKQQMGGKKFLTPEKVREILVQSGVSPTSDGGCSIGKQPRVDVALNLFDTYWSSIRQNFPDLVRGDEIKGTRRQQLRQQGVGLICKMRDPANSDPSCPETAQCMMRPGYRVSIRHNPGEDWQFNVSNQSGGSDGYGYCQNTLCLPVDTVQSDYDCMAGAIWPAGIVTGKQLDFDGDEKADLVNWTQNGWQMALSSIGPINETRSSWDLQINTPMNMGRWVWPVVEDYNSDGRADLAVWDKEHGVWYIAFTNKALVNNGTWHGWDKQIQLPYHDVLNRDVRLAKYSRPVQGDYNSDGWIDLALQTSDGYWRIAWGNKDYNYNRNFDINLKYLTDAQLAEAPGWAYLPTPEVSFWNGAGVTFKVPDGITGAGELWFVSMTGLGSSPYLDINDRPVLFNGNESIPVKGDILKTSEGNWFEFDAIQEKVLLTTPSGIYGGLDCHPFMADYDGDGKLDRAVQCPTEFRTVMSSDGSVHHIPFGYDVTKFSLPGKVYFGGISYQTVQQLINYQLQISPDPPVIPVDMVQNY